jgi:hypothetical protein
MGEIRLQNEAVHSDSVVRSVVWMGMVSLLPCSRAQIMPVNGQPFALTDFETGSEGGEFLAFTHSEVNGTGQTAVVDYRGGPR